MFVLSQLLLTIWLSFGSGVVVFLGCCFITTCNNVQDVFLGHCLVCNNMSERTLQTQIMESVSMVLRIFCAILQRFALHLSYWAVAYFWFNVSIFISNKRCFLLILKDSYIITKTPISLLRMSTLPHFDEKKCRNYLNSYPHVLAWSIWLST